MRLGVQVSIQGGLDKVVDRALHLGCNTVQFFSRNPREWRRKRLNKREVELFRKNLKNKDIKPVVVHAPYTSNLASPRKKLFYDSLRVFIKDIKDANLLEADYFVFHMGSHSKTSEIEGLKRVSYALKTTLRKVGTKTIILIENTSGSGSWLGYRFWHHAFVLKRLNWSNKIGLCLDTCHAWSAGYDVSSRRGLEKMLEEIDAHIGLERLKLIHLNDSKDPLGSRRDRHAHIGEGFIGEEGFRNILTHPLLKDLPFILETPNKEPQDDLKNLERVKRIYNGL